MPLVAHYPLHSDVTDVRGGNDGTNNGVTFVAGGPIGQDAGDFDGSSDYIDIPESLLSGETEATISVLFKVDTLPSASHAGVVEFSDSTFDNLFAIRVEDSGNVRFYTHASGTSNSSASGTINTGQWYRATLVTDGSDQEGYIDAEERVTTSTSASFGTFDSGQIGRDSDPDYIDGQIADVRVYDHALSPSEVSYLYQVSQSGQYRSDYKTL